MPDSKPYRAQCPLCGQFLAASDVYGDNHRPRCPVAQIRRLDEERRRRDREWKPTEMTPGDWGMRWLSS